MTIMFCLKLHTTQPKEMILKMVKHIVNAVRKNVLERCCVYKINISILLASNVQFVNLLLPKEGFFARMGSISVLQITNQDLEPNVPHVGNMLRVKWSQRLATHTIKPALLVQNAIKLFLVVNVLHIQEKLFYVQNVAIFLKRIIYKPSQLQNVVGAMEN